MSRLRWALALLVLFLFACASSVRAQNFAIDWFTIDSGGGASTGLVYAVTGTIGQPDAGKSSGGNYTLDGGFWSVVLAVQRPGVPFLSVRRSGANVILSWPVSARDFTLEEAANLRAPISWQGVEQSPTSEVSNFTVTLPASAGYKFYRLRSLP